MQLPVVNFSRSGQILISLLVSIALFSILSHALFTLVSSSYSLASYTKARNTAKQLATEKIEIIKNLPFNQIGTVGGIPTGLLVQSENISKNGLTFEVTTSVIYIDDPFDQQLPNDLLPTDYKRVRVDVAWEGLAASRKNPVTLVTDISPVGIESISGGGTLSIIVFNEDIEPVPQADVTIVAATSPAVNLTLKTGDNGRVILPGAPPCSNLCYQITVQKSGYSTDRTYSISEVTNPDNPHLNMTAGQLTEKSFSIDKVGSINITSTNNRENNFDLLPNINFTLRGNKTIGTDSDDQMVYKYLETLTTDENGNITISDLETDNYMLYVNPASGYDISGTNPLLPVHIAPSANLSLKFALSPDTPNSMLIAFIDANQSQIASVSARIYDAGGFEATSSSGLADNPDFGQVFFDNLVAKIYNFTATASAYLDFTGTLDVIDYKSEKIPLQAN